MVLRTVVADWCVRRSEQGGRSGDAGPAILAREPIAEELRDAEALEEAFEDRQGPDPPRVEGSSLGLGGFPRPSRLWLIVHARGSRGSSNDPSRSLGPGFRSP